MQISYFACQQVGRITQHFHPEAKQLDLETKAQRQERIQRNIEAARKCREQRMEHSRQLIEETEKLEKEMHELEEEILRLHIKRLALQKLLSSDATGHYAFCMYCRFSLV